MKARSAEQKRRRHPYLARSFEAGDTQIAVRFFAPVADRGDYRCDFEIDWGEQPRSSRAFGIDAIQSMLLAMSVVDAELAAWAKGKRVKLTWLGEEHLGLPRWNARGQLLLATPRRRPPTPRNRPNSPAKRSKR